MMSEAQVRELLATLEQNSQTDQNPVRVLAFSGGVSALKMVLGEQ
jgi:hypothetical protein